MGSSAPFFSAMCHSVHGRPRRNWHDLASAGANCSGVRFFGNFMRVTTRGSNKISTTKTGRQPFEKWVASVEVTAVSSNLGERKAGKKCCSSNSSCGGRRRFKTLSTPEHVFN